MTSKEYLRQACRLDKRISINLEEVTALRELAASVSSIRLKDRVQTSMKGEAPFLSCMEKIMLLEEKINKETHMLMDLKEQMLDAIGTVPNMNEQMVLRYRYIHNRTWEQIGTELHVDARTVRRWHDSALSHVTLPKNPIII